MDNGAHETRDDHAHDGPAPVDVLVVGGGAAGLAAALSLGRSRRSVMVVDAGEPRNGPADGVHALLTRDGTPPAELRALARNEVAGYGVTLRDGRVIGASRHGGRFQVHLDDGDTVVTRRLVIATGLVDELPDVAGLAEHWGGDVVHCPYCHGWEVRDRRIGVLATTIDAAVHQAGLFRQLSDRVVLLTHASDEPDAHVAQRLAARRVDVVEGLVERVLGSDDGITGVRLADGREVLLDTLVVAPRFHVDLPVLAELGLSIEAHPSGMGTYVPSGAGGVTSVPGVVVAGNVTDPMAQVVAAMAQGNLAGAMTNADLVEEDTTLAATGTSRRRSPSTPAAWDELYTTRAEGQPIWSGAANGTLVAEVADLPAGSVLDVGAGEGGDVIWLARRGWSVTALEPSRVAVDRARIAADAAGAEVTWILDGMTAEVAAHGPFDLVSAQYPAMPSADPGVIPALLAAVAPGGTLLVVHHDRSSPHPGDHAEERSFDPGDYVQPADVFAALDDDWEVEVHETRPRRDVPDGARHVDDVVLRARRRSR